MFLEIYDILCICLKITVMNHFVSSLLFSFTNIGQHIHFFRKYYSYVVPSLMRGTQYSTQTCNVTVRGFAYHLLGTATHLGPWMTAIFHATFFSDHSPLVLILVLWPWHAQNPCLCQDSNPWPLWCKAVAPIATPQQVSKYISKPM